MPDLVGFWGLGEFFFKFWVWVFLGSVLFVCLLFGGVFFFVVGGLGFFSPASVIDFTSIENVYSPSHYS